MLGGIERVDNEGDVMPLTGGKHHGPAGVRDERTHLHTVVLHHSPHVGAVYIRAVGAAGQVTPAARKVADALQASPKQTAICSLIIIIRITVQRAIVGR